MVRTSVAVDVEGIGGKMVEVAWIFPPMKPEIDLQVCNWETFLNQSHSL